MAKPNEYRIEGQTAVLVIPNKRGLLECRVDADRLSEVLTHRWYGVYEPVGKRFYAATSDYSGPKRKTVYIHRFLCGNPPSVIDHRDGNGLNNTSTNLRVTTQSVNQLNRPRTGKKPLSGYRGVRFEGRRWRATVIEHGKALHLGLHDTPELASAAVQSYLASVLGSSFPEVSQ